MNLTGRKLGRSLALLLLLVMFKLVNNCIAIISERVNLVLKPDAMEEPKEDIDLVQVLQRIKSQHDFRTLFVLREREDDCGNQSYLQKLEVPTLLLELNQNLYIKGIFNSDLLSLVCLRNDLNEALIEKLAENLQHIRSSRVLFIWQQENVDYTERIRAVTHLVKLCKAHEMPRIVIIFRDFNKTYTYYTYQQFPALTIESQSFLNLSGDIFPASPKNLYHQPLRTASDWIEPNVIKYTDGNGKLHITGYVTNLVMTFAEKLNATLQFPTSNSTVLYYGRLLTLTRNNSIDFAMSLSTPKTQLNPEEYSYMVFIGKWGPMFTVEPKIEIKQVYFHNLNRNAVYLIGFLIAMLSAVNKLLSANWGGKNNAHPQKLLQLLINSRSLRAMLGQSFPLPRRRGFKQRLCLVLLLFSGFLISNMYTGSLSSNLTNLPAAYSISSFDDFLNTRKEIMITEPQKGFLISLKTHSFWSKYEQCFVIEDSQQRLNALRDSLNTTFGYAVTSFDWSIIKEQQKYFDRRLFRIAPQMVFDDFYIAAMPVRENSIFRDELNAFILQTEASGLIKYWKSLTFSEMLKMGKFSKIAPSNSDTHVPIRSEDLYWVWLAYLLMHFLALIVFGVELLVFRWRRRQMS